MRLNQKVRRPVEVKVLIGFFSLRACLLVLMQAFSNDTFTNLTIETGKCKNSKRNSSLCVIYSVVFLTCDCLEVSLDVCELFELNLCCM